MNDEAVYRTAPATPGLLTKGKGLTVKVIERAGMKLQHQLPGLKESTTPTKPDRFIHTSGGKGDCKKRGFSL